MSRHEQARNGTNGMTTFLTSQEMQELINVDRSTVYRMAEDGRLPGVKIGRQWRFPADQVHAQLGLAATRAPLPVEEPATGAGDHPGLDQLLVPEVAQSVADLMGDLFGVMAVITDMDGQPITAVANPCGYYAAIANQPGAVEACLQQWRLFAEEPHVAPRFVRTHLGFLCARTFVWVDLRPVGMIVVGGVTPPAWPPSQEAVEAIADEVGVPHRNLLDAVDDTWHVDIDEQRRILRLLPQMGDLVSQLASARSQLVTRTSATTPQGGG
jgi:excisionase family DNA binding protein